MAIRLQFRLSSLLITQAMLAFLLYMNMECQRNGWPFESHLLGWDSFYVISGPALIVNGAMWTTLLTLALFGSEYLCKPEAWKKQFWLGIRNGVYNLTFASWICLGLMLNALLILNLAFSPAPTQVLVVYAGSDARFIGWPWAFSLDTVIDYYWIDPYLWLDLLVWLALLMTSVFIPDRLVQHFIATQSREVPQ